MRELLKTGTLRRSLVSSVGSMWASYDWEEDQIRETKKYIIKFLFDDNGPHFIATSKSTDKSYAVEAYRNFWIHGDRIWWSAYLLKEEKK